MENYFGPSVDYGNQHGNLANFWGAGRGKPLYSVGLFQGGLISVLPSSTLFLTRLELAKKSQRLNPGSFFGSISFWRIYKNRCDIDAVCGECIPRPRRALGPAIGDHLLALKCVWLAWLWR